MFLKMFLLAFLQILHVSIAKKDPLITRINASQLVNVTYDEKSFNFERPIVEVKLFKNFPKSASSRIYGKAQADLDSVRR